MRIEQLAFWNRSRAKKERGRLGRSEVLRTRGGPPAGGGAWWLMILLSAMLGAGHAAPSPAPVDNPDQRMGPVLQGIKDGMYDWADQELGKLIRDFPTWDKLNQAVLYQARARFAERQYQSAAELLKARKGQAGNLADEYQYWIGRAELEKGDFSGAAADFELLLKNFPNSALRLDAAYGQASAQFKAGNFVQAIDLLKNPGSHFQKAAAGSTNSAVVAEGYLLLGQALRAQGDYRAAEETLQQLGSRNPGGKYEWQRQYLLARNALAGRHPELALARATNLVAAAAALNVPLLSAQSLALEAEILVELKQPARAVQKYEQIIQLKDLELDEQRKALLNLVELAASQNQISMAVQRLETFIGQHPQDVSLDLLRLTLGELCLRQYSPLKLPGEKSATHALGTNWLQRAEAEFTAVISTYTNSPYLGKAHLNRGWCAWEQAKLSDAPSKYADALTSFKAAALSLPRSEDEATARLKWADCSFELKDFNGALTNYQRLIENYANFPTVRDQLFEGVLYQIVRASIEAHQLVHAKAAIDKMLQWFPSGEQVDNSLLLYGQALVEAGKPAEGRQAFQMILERFPKSSLISDTALATAQSYIRETNWSEAIHGYNRWLKEHPNHPARPQVEFDRAWTHYLAGDEKGAFVLFTNFTGHFATHPLWPTAQMWVADHFYRTNDFENAEINYQLLFHLENNQQSAGVVHQAQLMAAYAAFKRQGYANARDYLRTLINNKPAGLLPEALFLLGNTYAEDRPPDPTNSVSNFREALAAFGVIVDKYSSNRFAPLAWGRIGDCKLQLASQEPKLYPEVTNAYQNVIDSPIADAEARSQAEVGLGLALEKMAQMKTGSEASQLLQDAFHHYLTVLYGNNVRLNAGERSDPFWVSRAALAAARLAESLQRRTEAINLYVRLQELLPGNKALWQRKIEDLRRTPEPLKRGGI